MRGPRLNVERRQVLQVLASSPDGVNEEFVVRGHGFTRRMLTSLVRAGLATAQPESMKGLTARRSRSSGSRLRWQGDRRSKARRMSWRSPYESAFCCSAWSSSTDWQRAVE